MALLWSIMYEILKSSTFALYIQRHFVDGMFLSSMLLKIKLIKTWNIIKS